MKKMNQITIREFDERYYELDGQYYPSVTYVLDVAYPTAKELIKWVGDVGNEEAERRKNEAADSGSIIHDAIDRLLTGQTIPTMNLNLKEKRCIAAFLDWWETEQPQTISNEYQCLNKRMRYAGTVDWKGRIKSDNYENVWIIDWKSSKSIHQQQKVQVSAYMLADKQATHGAILHLGNTTKKRWTFSPVKYDECIEQFKAAKQMFDLLVKKQSPTIEEYPEFFQLPIL